MRVRWIRMVAGVLLLFLVAGALSACGARQPGTGQPEAPAAPGTPPGGAGTPAFGGEEMIPPRAAPDFDLVDRTGARVRFKDLKGRVLLVSFGYTGCPDICPTLARSFKLVEQEMAGSMGKEVDLLFISVDPEGDTPERANRWTEAFGGRWHFLTGKRPELEKVWKGYGIVVKKDGAGVGHAVRTYLIDRHGLVRVRYAGLGWDKAALQDIRRLLAE